MSEFDIKHHIDARHLLCPMPVIKLQTVVSDADNGDIIHLLCTDPGVTQDVPTWVRIHGHQIIGGNYDDFDTGENITIIIKVINTH